MGAIDQLQSASLVSQALCRQALAEARADPAKMPALQQAFDTKQEQHFEKPEQYDQLLQFIQAWQSDTFELRPNTDNRLPRRPTVTEARITKVEEHKQLVEMNPPAPPVNPGRYRDPLHITGVAEPGSKVEVYNASQPGRPVIASTMADATGKYRIELTDETKFIFGDQMGVVAKDNAGQKSRALIVPTEPFMVTNTTTEYVQRRGMPVVRTDVTSSMRALDVNHDERDPFYQDRLVKKVASEPRAVGEPWTMQITGGDDAVEPNSTISVQIGSETFTTKAADDGTFALKLSGFTPGQRLKLEIRDVNGKGVDQPLQAPHVAFEHNRIAAGVTVAPTFTAPTGLRETIGTDAPFIAIKASDVTVPFGAVVVKNETTGQVFELAADDKGSISAALGGVGEFDVLQVATRDANGNFSERTTRMVVLPEKQAYGQLMMPVDELGPKNIHHLKKVLEAIEGPPHDLFTKKNGVDVKDPRGPFIGLPAIKGLPPFGQLAIVRDGEVTQTLRADKDGVIRGFLRGVNVGDRLDVRVLDAAGRRFGDGVVGYEVPGAKSKTKLVDENFHTPSDARALKDLVELVGSGTLDVEHAWVQPFNVGAQANPPADSSSFKLHYAPLVFASTVGQPVSVPDAVPQQLIEQLPDALAAKFATATTVAAHMKAISIAVNDNAGTQRLTITNGRGTICSVGVDYAVGSVNAGSFSQPLTAAHLPQLAEGLRSSLALVAAAYDQGKEPGDLVYDRAMSAAKTILYALDRFAVANPASRTDARAAAVEGVPKDFNFELFAKDLIPPQAQTTPLASVTGRRTSTMSLIEARQASLGRVEVKPTPSSSTALMPPRVDVAAVLRQSQHLHQSPIVVRGRGTPGEIVQVFNVSVGARQLVGESIVGPDGRFEMIANGAGAVGDQLGVVA
ncbi:MAG TPA: Ig-like domain-containing protein, partial [Myxococcota bacterium]